MIFRAGSSAIRLACDECDREPEGTGFLTFKEAFAWAKNHNWHVERDKFGDWTHTCPDCAREIGLYPPDKEVCEPTMPQEPPKANWVKWGDRSNY